MHSRRTGYPSGDSVLAREFESGPALYNSNMDQVTIEFDEPLYLLSVTGGLPTFVGGDSEAH